MNLLTKEVQGYKNFLETTNNEWIVKGFIDVNKNVYTITNDTKVVSKIIEILLSGKNQMQNRPYQEIISALLQNILSGQEKMNVDTTSLIVISWNN